MITGESRLEAPGSEGGVATQNIPQKGSRPIARGTEIRQRDTAVCQDSLPSPLPQGESSGAVRKKVKSADVPEKGNQAMCANLVKADPELLHKRKWRGGANR